MKSILLKAFEREVNWIKAANISLIWRGWWKKLPNSIGEFLKFWFKDAKIADQNELFLIKELDKAEKNSDPIELGKFFHEQDWRNLSSKALQRLYAYQYRMEIKAPHFEEEIFKRLKDSAFQWIRNHPVTPPLTARAFYQLQKTACYADFCTLIDRSQEIRAAFMTWMLQDENDPEIFIQFPALAEKIANANLSGRIGQLGSDNLKISTIEVNGRVKKIVTLPFEGRPINILDPDQPVSFRGEYTLTIEEIFEVFARKNIEVGNLEMMKEGIINWNIHHLGYWDAKEKKHIQIDVAKKNWWEQLPLFEVLTRRQLAKRYQLNIRNGEWVAVPKATRGKQNLDFLETHAFLEVAIPIDENRYAIYDFGKLALKYPRTSWEKLTMMTKTVHATVAYPDENVYYTHRQHGFHPFRLTRDQGSALMDLIKKDIEISRELNFVYQIESENCAKWVHDLLEKVLQRQEVPDFFRMQLLDTEPEGFVAHLFSWIKLLPTHWQVPVLAHLHLPLGAGRAVWINEEGRSVSKSLADHTFFKTGQIFLPALLIVKISIQKSISMFSRYAFRFSLINRDLIKKLIVLGSVFPLQWIRKFRCKEIFRRV